MFYRLQRHPVPVVAHFDHCLVLTYALPAEFVARLLPPGLDVDRFGDRGFLAIAMVQTRSLRPAGLPKWLGKDFFLSGYRLFARFRKPDGRWLRGLRILRSDTDRRSMAFFGNLLTHYNYRLADVDVEQKADRLGIRIVTPNREADLHVIADLGRPSAPLPPNSCFENLRQARRFAGPLPFTFDYEVQTHSIVAIKGTRQNWHPQPVTADALTNTFFDQPPFRGITPVLASAFYLREIPYRWERGVRYRLPTSVNGERHLRRQPAMFMEVGR